MQDHTYMSRQNLADISSYAKHSLDGLERGAGDLPQWTNDMISSIRTHMKDVVHFLRNQEREGKRYGVDDSFSHGAAYMATKNLREISEYADEAISHLEQGAGILPGWVEHKLSISAEGMDRLGHWLANENIEGRQYGAQVGSDLAYPKASMRQYGSHLQPVPGDAGDAFYFQGRTDGLKNTFNLPDSGLGRNIYTQGWEEGNYGGWPRDGSRGSALNRHRGMALEALKNRELPLPPPDIPYSKSHQAPEGWGYVDFDGGSDAWIPPGWGDGRVYGQRGGGGRGGGGGGGGGGRGGGGPGGGGGRGGGGRGPGGGGSRGRPGGGPGGRRPGGARPGLGWGPGQAGVGPGGGRRRPDRGRGRHRRHHGGHIYPYWNIPYYPEYYPVYVEQDAPLTISHVYSGLSDKDFYPEIPQAHGVIGMTGSGFDQIDSDYLRIRFQINSSAYQERDALIVNRSSGKIEIALPIDDKFLPGFSLIAIGYYTEDGQLVSLSQQFFTAAPYPFRSFEAMPQRRFSAALGPSSSAPRPGGGKPPGSSRIPTAGPGSTSIPRQPPRSGRIPTEPPDVGEPPPFRVVYQNGYGASGEPPTAPMLPSKMEGRLPPSRMLEIHRSRLPTRMRQEDTGRTFGVPGIPFPEPGWAGQAGVAQIPHPSRGGGSEVAQTYGSLGYASMGDGSMDLAVRGGRRMASTGKNKRSKRSRRR